MPARGKTVYSRLIFVLPHELVLAWRTARRRRVCSRVEALDPARSVVPLYRWPMGRSMGADQGDQKSVLQAERLGRKGSGGGRGSRGAVLVRRGLLCPDPGLDPSPPQRPEGMRSGRENIGTSPAVTPTTPAQVKVSFSSYLSLPFNAQQQVFICVSC
jgi:hypothetical protein